MENDYHLNEDVPPDEFFEDQTPVGNLLESPEPSEEHEHTSSFEPVVPGLLDDFISLSALLALTNVENELKTLHNHCMRSFAAIADRYGSYCALQMLLASTPVEASVHDELPPSFDNDWDFRALQSPKRLIAKVGSENYFESLGYDIIISCAVLLEATFKSLSTWAKLQKSKAPEGFDGKKYTGTTIKCILSLAKDRNVEFHVQSHGNGLCFLNSLIKVRNIIVHNDGRVDSLKDLCLEHSLFGKMEVNQRVPMTKSILQDVLGFVAHMLAPSIALLAFHDVGRDDLVRFLTDHWDDEKKWDRYPEVYDVWVCDYCFNTVGAHKD